MHAASGAPCHDELVSPERVFERELQRGISAAQPEDEKHTEAMHASMPCHAKARRQGRTASPLCTPSTTAMLFMPSMDLCQADNA
mmetsp:Transcript_15806/g.55033  ORF Transcript_15806/g.55033 Transcript_15806/m.55033 type:complete len:85 (+) Transcript_15806:46-300(+)